MHGKCQRVFFTVLYLQVLLEKLDVPSIMFIPSNLCATFPFNTNNALVVDIGYKETVATPVRILLFCSQFLLGSRRNYNVNQ